MTPVALEKAESLRKYALAQGAQISTFALVLTDVEGIELCDWLVHENPGNTLLELDVEIAKRTGNPWTILTHFALLGLEILPVTSTH